MINDEISLDGTNLILQVNAVLLVDPNSLNIPRSIKKKSLEKTQNLMLIEYWKCLRAKKIHFTMQYVLIQHLE